MCIDYISMYTLMVHIYKEKLKRKKFTFNKFIYLLFPSADLLEAHKFRVSFANADKMAGTEILSIDLRLSRIYIYIYTYSYIYERIFSSPVLLFESVCTSGFQTLYFFLYFVLSFHRKFVSLNTEKNGVLLFGKSEMEDITS